MEKFQKIDFSRLKRGISILEEVLRFVPASGIKRSTKKDKYYTLCWLHEEKTPSMCLNNDTNTYHCYGCGASGSVLDVRLYFGGFNPHSGVEVVKAARQMLEEYSANGGSGRSRIESADFEKLKVSPKNLKTATKRYFQAELYQPELAHERLIKSKSVREYAARRGWLIPESRYPLGAGYSFGPARRELVLEFPKLVQTRHTARCVGLEKDWENSNQRLVAGLKKRLTPLAEKLWEQQIHLGNCSDHITKPPRWSALPPYREWIPWEFDARQKAEVLCVTEGPGDGLRLANELLRNGVEYHFHIVAVDSASTLRSQNFVRTMQENKSVSFFDGFKELWFFFDRDRAGQDAVQAVSDLMKLLQPTGVVKFIEVPEVCQAADMKGFDLSDYFDNEGCVSDLLKIVDRTDRLII